MGDLYGRGKRRGWRRVHQSCGHATKIESTRGHMRGRKRGGFMLGGGRWRTSERDGGSEGVNEPLRDSHDWDE